MGSYCYHPNKNTFQVSMSVAFAEMAVFFLYLNLFHWHGAFSKDREARKIKLSATYAFRPYYQLNFNVNIHYVNVFKCAIHIYI